MKKAGCLFVFFIVVFLNVGYSQNGLALPSVVPPPADAGTLGKYGDVPVSLSNGAASITIPLFDIKTPRLGLPIDMNYSTSGIKVDDVASWVGLGWSLNAGGVITRAVKGIDDFASGGFYSTTLPALSSITPQNSWLYFQQVMNHGKDTEPDYFFFNFGGRSGKFVFDETKTPLIIDRQLPLKISYSGGVFTILDEKGNAYLFSTPESAISGDYHGGTPTTYYTSSWYLTQIISYDKSDTISLTYQPDQNALIQTSFTFSQAVGPYYSYNDYGGGGCGYSLHYSGQDDAGNILGEPYTQSYPQRLQQISFKNGKIIFYSSTGRQDGVGAKLDSAIVYRFDYAGNYYVPLKKIKLAFGYYYTNLPNPPAATPSSYRLRLDSVSLSGGDDVYGGSYQCQYDSTMLPYINSMGRDLFGFYNGKNDNLGLIPTQVVSYGGYSYNVGGADRTTDSLFIKSGMLTKIVYPTSGYSKFEFESNRYQGASTSNTAEANAVGGSHEADSSDFTTTATSSAMVIITFSSYGYTTVTTRPYAVIKNISTGQVYTYLNMSPNSGSTASFTFHLDIGVTYRIISYAFQDSRVKTNITFDWQTFDNVTVLGGGLRVKSITDYDLTGQFLRAKRFKYGRDESGFGYLPSSSSILATNNAVRNFSWHCSQDMGGSNCGNGGSGIVAREVFSAGSIYDMFSLAGSPITYDQVTSYNVDSSGNTAGKSVSDFSRYSNGVVPSTTNYFEAFQIVNSGYVGEQLLSQTDYALKGSVYWPVKKISTDYLRTPRLQSRGLKIGIKATVIGGASALDSAAVVNCFNTLYYYTEFPIYGGSVLPALQTTYLYDQDDSNHYVLNTVNYTYDDYDHNQPTRIYESQSSGSDQLTINRYPVESDSVMGLNSGEAAVLSSMVTKHNVSTLIQNQVYRNNTLVSQQTYHHALSASSIAFPSSLDVKMGAYNSEPRLQYDQYDISGNILQQAKTSDVKETYIWDYSSSLPIAKAVNASLTDVAYTSFEADGKGGWSFSANFQRDPNAPTGQRYYLLASPNTISKTGLTASKKYIVSYWSNGGSYSVTSSSSVTTGKTVSGWTYFEHTVTGTTSVSISGSGSIDEVRLYPANSSMSTFTYEPLVGITSLSAPDAKTTYYEYDGLGRQVVIRDLNRNILKSFCYSLAKSPNACKLYYNEEMVDATKRRNNCGSGYTGGYVNYVVPAKSYLSNNSLNAVNKIALDEVQANAQSNANSVGSCTLVGTISYRNTLTISASMKLVNSATGVTYNLYSLQPNISTYTVLSSEVPQGTYDVYFYASGSNRYQVGTVYQYNVTNPVFTNVVMGNSLDVVVGPYP